MLEILSQIGSIVYCLLKAYLIYVVLVVLWKLYICLKNHVISKIWKVNLKTDYGTWAVVTGCTDGIGRAYSNELAKRGINLVLVSRSLDKLKIVSSEIMSKFEVKAEIIRVDFTNGFKVYNDLEEKLKNRTIGILVNNVGVNQPVPVSFEDVSQDAIRAHLTVNMAAPTYLTSLILPSMIKAGKGAIINVSSLTAMNPNPFAGLYSASKVYNYFFSEALKFELKNKGIFVQTVTPGYVVTNMIRHLSDLNIEGFFNPTPEKYAADAVSTIGYTTNTCGYYGHELLSILFYILPQGLLVKMSVKWRLRFGFFKTTPKSKKRSN